VEFQEAADKIQELLSWLTTKCHHFSII
jgi:hypothetical protein